MQFDPRTSVTTRVETPDDFDDIFFLTHGVGDNPVIEQNIVVRNMMDPNEPTLQEVRLCKLLIKGTGVVEAYRKSFEMSLEQMSDKSVRTAVDRLLKRPRVAKKMYELRTVLMEMEETDLMSIISDLNEDRRLARELGQPSAAIQATKVKAAMLGLSNENKTTTNIVVNLSDTQKKNLLSRIGHRVLDSAEPPIEDAEFEDLD